MNDRLLTAVVYRSYCLVHESPRHDEDVASVVQNIRKIASNEIKDQVIYRQDSILFITFLVVFKRASDSFRFHDRILAR